MYTRLHSLGARKRSERKEAMISINPEQNETEMELAAAGDSVGTFQEVNAAESLETAEMKPMAAGHTVVVGSVG